MKASLSRDILAALLGVSPQTPLDRDDMARALRPVLYAASSLSPRLLQFCEAMIATMESLGITVRDGREAAGTDGRFEAGTVILAPGIFTDAELAINRVATLYNNIIVGIYDEPPPLTAGSLPQQRLDAVVGRLARDMVHILIYVTADSWTICTMNGGVVTFDSPLPTVDEVRNVLVPKLTAQVVPPRAGDLDILHGELRPDTPLFRSIATDFAACSSAWQNSVYLLTHTSTDKLDYRSPFYRRIVSRYLDQRSGMSYGFFARQMPVAVAEASRSPHPGSIPVALNSGVYHVTVPEVSVITTRSGCRKHCLDPLKDLVAIGCRFSGGIMRPWLKTPPGTDSSSPAKPSFDTLTILAHALGNAIIASILKERVPDSLFARKLAESGASMTHWHDYPDLSHLPEGYFLHGDENPPVACSTPQSAAYSLLGKIAALEQALAQGSEYRGDVHVEPNHGTNVIGILSLAETARHFNRPMRQPQT